jgi:hypothetical protein
VARVLPMLACVALLVSFPAAGAGASKTRNPTRRYPLLYRVGGIAVFGAKGRLPSGFCPPRPLPLSRHDLATATRLVRAGIPRLFPPRSRERRRGALDRSNALVRARLGRTALGGDYAQLVCSRRVRLRTAVVTIRYPHVKSASLSQNVLLMSHIPEGWDIWAVLH